jgi:hypothetical protein
MPYALMGLLIGAFIALAALAGGFAADQNFGFLAPFLGVGAIVPFPLFYGCVGFVFTLIGAWLCNVVAGMVGGIELDVA